MNDRGQIVGIGVEIVDGEVQGVHAFLATPVAGRGAPDLVASHPAARPSALPPAAARRRGGR